MTSEALEVKQPAMVASVGTTPMMQQYLEIKATNPEALLFFRMGDFYELFFNDAIIAAPILEVALTNRGKHLDQDIPMCGVPFHSVKPYIQKLIEKGFKKILLYGAGEVAEIMLQVMNDDNTLPLEVVAVIDDNPNKKGEIIVNLPIIQKEDIIKFKHDGILVSSYKHHESINANLKSINYPSQKIINFFDN